MPKKKIGLALGSGSARGWAHIGVINGLHDLGINIDIVTGCSAGALVGAAFACQKLTELESWVRSVSSWDIMKLSDLTWQKGGLLQGNKVFTVLADIIHVKQIQDCQIKFATVATNLSSGRELWLTKGDLLQAIRASCSIPGIFAPVYYNDSWLVDGALVNPLPISLARALGADIVIAVDLQNDANLMEEMFSDEKENLGKQKSSKWRNKLSGLFERDNNTPSVFQIMNTSIELLENRIKNNRLANDPPEILIRPICSKISFFDFHRAEESIEIGYQTVQKQREQIIEFMQKRN